MSRLLDELVGEIITNPPETAAPRLMRRDVVAGLELLDWSLHPSHIIRVVETLGFVDAYTMKRTFDLEVSLDPMGRDELRADRIWSSPARVGPSDDGDHHIWTPLLLIPRPLEVPIDVRTTSGEARSRPRGADVRETLGAAIQHLLDETLEEGSDDQRGREPAERLISLHDVAVWTVKKAFVNVCASGPGSPHSAQRLRTLHARSGPVDGARRTGMVPVPLDELARGETDESKRRAFGLLQSIAANEPFMELVELVFGNVLIVAALDSRQRDHGLHLEMPRAHALRESSDHRLLPRTRRILDPRDHNFTAHICIPLPRSVEQYRLQLDGSTDGDNRAEASLAVVAAVTLEPGPMKRMGVAVTDAAGLVAWAVDQLVVDEDIPRARRGALATMAFAVSEARATLEQLGYVADQQASRARDVRTRWAMAGPRVVTRKFPYVDDRHRRLTQAIGKASAELAYAEALAEDADDAISAGKGREADGLTRQLVESGRCAGRDLRAVAEVCREDLADVQLTTERAPGTDTGRVRLDRPFVRGVPAPETTSVDVWVAMTDQTTVYAVLMLVPPIIMLLLIWLFGALLLESPAWPVAYSIDNGVRDRVLDRPADALAAIMLLIPALAVGQISLPPSSSVRGKLRRAFRLQIYTGVITASICATVVAAAVTESSDASELLLLLRTLRTASVIVGLWVVWAVVASVLRPRYVWMPKGMQRHLVGDGVHKPRRNQYACKSSDVVFDLALPEGSTMEHQR